MLRYADQIGCTYFPRDEALAQRGVDTELYLTGILEPQLFKRNLIIVNAEWAAEIIRCLRFPPA